MIDTVAEKITGIFEDLLLWMFESFITPFADLRMIHTLIFGRDEKLSTVWGTFRPDELSLALGPIYYTMMGLAGVLLITLIVVNGMRISSSGANPNSRNALFEFLKDLLFVGVVLINLPLVYDLLFAINLNIVKLFDSAYEAQQLSKLTGSLDDMNAATDTTMGVIGQIFVFLILIGLTIWANFYYLMRKVTLVILMAMGPVMIVFWLLPQFKSLTGAWFRELVGSIFVQAIHAFVFWTVVTLSASESSFVGTVIVYLIFIPITESIRRLLSMGGDMQDGFSKAGAMLGMAGIAGMVGSVKGALQDKSVMGSLKEAYNGAKTGQAAGGANGDNGAAGADSLKNTLGANAGSDIGTSTKAEKMLRTGDIFSRGGKAVFGMAGSIAGSPMGPVSSMIGASAGFAAGGAVAGVTGRAGAAMVQGMGARISKGLDAARNIGREDYGDALASETADNQTATWAKDNKDSVMAGLKEKFPDATPADLNKKFMAIQNQKREGFYQGAKANFNTAMTGASSEALGRDLANTSASVLTDRWAEENQGAFLAKYDQENPRMAGESESAYQNRRMTAFTDKKNEMRSQFHAAGISALRGRGLDEAMSKTEFMENMSPAVAGYSNVLNSETAQDAVQGAVGKMPGVQMFNDKGRPNVPYLASGLANASVQQQRENFISGQVDRGVPLEAANDNWNRNHAAPAYQQALSTYNNAIANMGDTRSLANGSTNMSGAVGLRAQQATAFLGAATGVSGFAQGVTNLRDSASAGAVGAGTHFANAVYGSEEGSAMSRGARAIVPAMRAGVESSMEGFIEDQGGAVNAQASLQNSAGYVGGVIMGAGGYRAGKQIASKFSPINTQVQETISSPSEVMQMAQTITDDRGNVQIAPGAVRQVITPDSSYIEVKTKTGENQVVSRMGAGHPGLKQGEVVYQDLHMQDETLVPKKPNGSQTGTYRLDSGGGRIPSNVAVGQNPNSLLGNPTNNTRHQPVSKQSTPSFNQNVDNGSFFVEDLEKANMSNVQVVVEKDRQFVTAQKEGVTYRVSPVYAGDSRQAAGEVRNIPMQVKNSTLKPNLSAGSQVAVDSFIPESGSNENYYTTNSLGGMVPNQEMMDMMPSRNAERAKRNVLKRAELDSVRRKQGLLG